MKSFRILSAVLATSLLVFTGCVKESIHTGIDGNKPGISQLTYEGVTHGGKTVTLKWSGAEAVNAGATSFSVQFVENADTTGGKLIKPDMYNTTISKTVQVEADENGVLPSEFSATMDGQTLGKKYYIRVRANYPMSIYSDWTWLTTADGNPAYFKVGRGVITEGIEDPYIYKVTGTSTGLIIKWDELPDAIGYQIEYKRSSESNWTVSTIAAGEKTVLKVANLPSETSFDVRAKTLTLAGDSEYCDVQTVSTRKPGSFPKEMKNADEFIAWLEGGVVEVNENETFTITDDIDLTNQSYTAMDESILGIFDGGGHTIKGVSSPLFYEVEASGAIKNLTVEGEISGAGERLAAIALANKGTISGVTSKVNLMFNAESSSQMFVAGIVAENTGTITDVKNEGSVTAVGTTALESAIVMGGIAAYSAGPITGETVNKGDVKFTGSVIRGVAVAGIVGYLENLLDGASNEGSVTVAAEYANGKCQIVNTASGTPAVAGIAAYGASDSFHIKGCTNYGSVNYSLSAIEKYTAANLNRNQFAGIVANPNGLVEDCENNGPVNVSVKSSKETAFTGSGHEHIVCVGGIGGGDYFPSSQDKTDYRNCTNNGNVTVDTDAAQANSAIGGICGWPGKEDTSRTNGTFNCTNTGRITLKGLGKGRVGGIHGGSGIIDGCINKGEVRLEGGVAACVAGGIAGFSSNGFKIVNCQSLGNVTSEIAAQGVGGILGNAGNQANSGRNFTGSNVACIVRNGEAANEYTGMVLGYYNGATTFVGIGTAEAPIPVRGKIVLNGVISSISAGNVKSLAAGTKNPSADNHPVFVVFDPTPFEDGGDEPDQPKLDAPANVKVDVFYNYTTVSWDAVNGAEWYVVEYKKADATTWTACDRTEETSCTIEGLEHGVSYSFRVRAFTSNGSGYSDEAAGETLPEINLGKPVITGATMTPKSADVAWNAVENATAYRIEMKGPEDEEWKTVAESVSETHFLVNGLRPEKTYQFRVKALGAGGNEGAEFSDPYSATTEAVTFTYPLSLDNADDFASWINVAAELAPETASVTLAKDIDLKNVEITGAASFAGSFDGAGHALKNVSAAAPLFGTLTGSVKDLTIEGAFAQSFDADDTAAEHKLAALAGYSTGSVTNVTNKASVTMTGAGTLSSPVIGGVVAIQQGGTFKGNKNTGAISLTHAGSVSIKNTSISDFHMFVVTAGVVGIFIHATAEDCVNEGTVSVLGKDPTKVTARHYVGGVIGTPQGATVTNCTNKGAITADFTDPTHHAAKQVWVGGIIGARNGDCTTEEGVTVIENCNNYGECTLIAENSVNNYLAGIAGQACIEATKSPITAEVLGKIVGCHNYGKLVKKGAGGCRIGGIHGGAATIENCVNEGEILVENISTAGAVGGLVGYPTQAYHPVTGSRNIGNMTATCDVTFAMGGLFGQGGNTNQSYAGCSVNCTMTAPASVLAGIVLGTAKTIASGKAITYGTTDSPIKVKGTVRGEALTADNFATFLVGDGGITAGGEIDTANVLFGE